MSKAFTREDSGGEDEDPSEALSDELPKGTKNYMTPAGADKLKTELKNLLNVARPELVQVISWAASNGDRSENGDYIYGKRRLREMDRRIRFLTRRLESAEIVDPKGQRSDRVLFGAQVTLRDEEGKQKTYRIVGIDEADARKGSVSWISPLAKAVMNTRVGDVVSLKTPKGEEELEILSIQYPCGTSLD